MANITQSHIVSIQGDRNFDKNLQKVDKQLDSLSKSIEGIKNISTVQLAGQLFSGLKKSADVLEKSLKRYQQMGGELKGMSAELANIKEDFELCNGILADYMIDNITKFANNTNIAGQNANLMQASFYAIAASLVDSYAALEKLTAKMASWTTAAEQSGWWDNVKEQFKKGPYGVTKEDEKQAQEAWDRMGAIQKESQADIFKEIEDKAQAEKDKLFKLYYEDYQGKQAEAGGKKAGGVIGKGVVKGLQEELAGSDTWAKIFDLEGTKEERLNQLVLGGATADEVLAFTESIEEEIANLRKQYNREVNDQKAMDEDWLAEYRKSKSKETSEAIKQDIESEADAWQNKLVDGAIRNLMDSVTTGFESLLAGETDFRSFSEDTMKSLGKNISNSALQVVTDNLVKMATGQADAVSTIPVVGPALAAAALGAGLALIPTIRAKLAPEPTVQYANGGYISSGLVHSSATGDSVPAMLAAGERVLSAKEAAAYDNANYAGAQGTTFNITINGSLASDSDIKRTVTTKLMPEIQRALKSGKGFI